MNNKNKEALNVFGNILGNSGFGRIIKSLAKVILIIDDAEQKEQAKEVFKEICDLQNEYLLQCNKTSDIKVKIYQQFSDVREALKGMIEIEKKLQGSLNMFIISKARKGG